MTVAEMNLGVSKIRFCFCNVNLEMPFKVCTFHAKISIVRRTVHRDPFVSIDTILQLNRSAIQEERVRSPVTAY